MEKKILNSAIPPDVLQAKAERYGINHYGFMTDKFRVACRAFKEGAEFAVINGFSKDGAEQERLSMEYSELKERHWVLKHRIDRKNIEILELKNSLKDVRARYFDLIEKTKD